MVGNVLLLLALLLLIFGVLAVAITGARAVAAVGVAVQPRSMCSCGCHCWWRIHSLLAYRAVPFARAGDSVWQQCVRVVNGLPVSTDGTEGNGYGIEAS